VYKTAKQIDPDLNVIVITGYPDSEILDRILQISPVTVLKKPLKVEQLNLSCTTAKAGELNNKVRSFWWACNVTSKQCRSTTGSCHLQLNRRILERFLHLNRRV
jgi:DNA-binding NtrC family response regulator